MQRVFIAGLALALLMPACAFAQSAFSGTWETQLSSVRNTGRPMVIHLRNGVYECNCTPPIKIKADGQDHAVAGHHGFDAVSVQVVDPDSIRVIYKDHGKIVTDETISASADGKTGTYEFTDNGGPAPVTGKAVAMRVAKGAAGSNGVAGTWQFGHWIDLSANARTFTYKVNGKSVDYSDPTGASYTAVIGGKAVAFTSPGDTGTTVSVRQLGPNELRETYRRDGKVTRTSTMTVAKDGKTMKAVNDNLQSGRVNVSVADRQ